MHRSLLLLVLLAVGAAVANNLKARCKSVELNVPKDWITMEEHCKNKVSEQVQEEIRAAMTYFAMGAHFSRDTVNRPGFAKLFFDSASEEREHALKLIDYLSMRGDIIKEGITWDINPLKESWNNGTSALTDALELEAHVTRHIREVIRHCEGGINDYHFVDYLTGEFLEEQHKGSRELAGRLVTLKKMAKNHGELAEFLFDKKLLAGEV